MKKSLFLIAFIICISCMGLIACGNEGSKEEGSLEEASLTIEPNKLTVGVHIGYEPMEYYDDNGEATGFDIELAGKLAEEMGLELEIVPCAWDAIFKNMESGNFDMICSCVSYTNERAEKYALTNNYLSNGLVLVVPKNQGINSIDDMTGKCFAVQLDTTADSVIQEFISKDDSMTIAQYENVTNAFDAMVGGDVQAVCTDSVVANYFILNNSDYDIVWESEDKEPICICISQTKAELRDNVNEALKSLSEKGVLEELSNKYFGANLTKDLD